MFWHPLFGALVVGPFSGIDVNRLLETPILAREVIVSLSAREIAQQANGVRLEGDAVLTLEGFRLEMAADLPAGEVVCQTEVMAPDSATDSFWLSLDGVQQRQPFSLPRGRFGTATFTLALAAPGRHRVELTLREDPGARIRGVQLARVYPKSPFPAMRAELVGQHPRLLFTRDDIARMRARLEDPRVRRFYRLPGVLSRRPPEYRPGQRNGGLFRGLPQYALGYVLSPDDRQRAALLQWLEMATTYGSVGVDLDAEYFLEGVALTYDWLYEVIPEDLRARVRERIARQTEELYRASLAGRTGGGHNFQQNHYWYAHLALALGAAALYGEEARAEHWLPWAWDRYERIALTFSPDGSFHEGPAYWDFSMPALYLYTDLYEWCTGRRIPAGDDGLRGQAQFRFHYLYPGLKRSAAMEDSSVNLGVPPAHTFLWEAKRFRDPITQGLAALLAPEPSSDPYRFLRLDENVPAQENVLTAIPLARYYRDVETAFARTSWEPDATYVAFVSRPLGGHRWSELCDRFGLGGTGHNHPEQNHFVLFGRGAVLAGDPGYTYDKQTRNHNTVLVDGRGQFGDGEMWPSPKPGRAQITHFSTQGDVAIVTGDATSAYPPELGLKRFERTLVLAGRDLVVLCDRLAADPPRTFSWLLHHWGKATLDQNTCTITRDQAQLTVIPLLPRDVRAETSTYRPQYVHPERDLTPTEPDVNLLELKAGPSAEVTFLVPLLVGEAGSKPAPVRLVPADNGEAVEAGGVLVAFKRGRGSMGVTLPWGETLRTEASVVVARVVAGQRQVITANEKGTRGER